MQRKQPTADGRLVTVCTGGKPNSGNLFSNCNVYFVCRDGKVIETLKHLFLHSPFTFTIMWEVLS